MTEVWAELSAYEGEFDLEKENCILISSGKNWMEQAAKDQLLAVSRLPGVVKAVGLPDLHPGRIPVGTAVLSRGVLYPHLLGNDIGCGMSLFDTGVNRRNGYQGWRPSGSWRIYRFPTHMRRSALYGTWEPWEEGTILRSSNVWSGFMTRRQPGAWGFVRTVFCFWSTAAPGDTARRSCHGFGCRRGLRMVLNRQRHIWLSMTEL